MRRAVLLGLFVMLGALADPKLYLKTRIIDTSTAGGIRASRPSALAETGNRVHLVIQYNHAPDNGDVQLLIDRGASVLGYVHQNGLIISTIDPASLEDLGLPWTSQFDPADKLSPLLSDKADDVSRPVLVEFHPDSNMADARRLVIEVGAELSDSPDLGVHHLLIYATTAQIAGLIAHDEVAYIFPASDQLVSGQPVTACASAITAQGVAGQYIPKVGDGWDGAGKGIAAITYFFSALTGQLPADTVKSEILRAFAEWAKYIKVTFSPVSTAGAPRSLDILFAKGAHGDGYAFDGPGGVLAHTFYPSPPNPEPLAGDMHFDEDEMWRIGVDKDLFSVALHEAGHALGLGHSDRPGAVMYPYYSMAATLTADDIGAIQDMYEPQNASNPGEPSIPTDPPVAPPSTPPTTPTAPSTPPPPVQPLSLSIVPFSQTTLAASIAVAGSVTGGSGVTSLNWISDRGQSGSVPAVTAWTAQVPVLVGSNSITFTATDSEPATVSRTIVVLRQSQPAPVAIQLAYPAGTGAFTTFQSAVNIRGSASHPAGIQSVAWSNDRGGSSLASGTNNWDSGPVALQPGVNSIIVTVTATDGAVGTVGVRVSYAPAAGNDTTAPTLSITSPIATTSTTINETMIVRGTASDNKGVTSVTWFSSSGASGSASGTTSWTTPPIGLIYGDNSIIVRAFDAAGNMSWRVVNVRRQ